MAEAVARHLVAAGTLVDDDPAAALAHARYARRRASRIAIVREAAGITAYHAGEWAEALAELRAARRMGGGPGHLAVMADIERAMGRPERAIELARGPEARELARSAQIELAIVVAGARRDLGELDAAVVALQVPELEASRRDPWSVRLFYAYADNLLAAGRESDALQWFVHAADADAEGMTDADVRIAELTGEPLADDGIEFAFDDEGSGGGGDEADEADEADDVAEIAADIAADDVAADDVAADEVAADEVAADWVAADDLAADGVAADDVAAEDVAAEDVAADGAWLPTDVAAEDVAAEDVAADGVAADIAADGVAAEDVAAEDVAAEDVAAEDVAADGVAADIAADGVAADGVAADEVAADDGGCRHRR